MHTELLVEGHGSTGDADGHMGLPACAKLTYCTDFTATILGLLLLSPAKSLTIYSTLFLPSCVFKVFEYFLLR